MVNSQFEVVMVSGLPMGKKIPAKPLRLRASTILQKAGWPASLRRYYPRQVQNRVFLCDSRGQGAITLSQPCMAPPAGLRTVGLDPKECKQNWQPCQRGLGRAQ